MVATMVVSPWQNAIEMAEMAASSLLDTLSLSTLSHPSLLNTLCSAHHRRRAAVPHATVDLPLHPSLASISASLFSYRAVSVPASRCTAPAPLLNSGLKLSLLF
ncbi:hypothetical protein PIB30_065990 [Stylosanthes scabra]|uniref:Uncharacterized protein n=1 Tax=Stylosanthes scabra TaxID=79078 RepID=A0ABU6QLQ0_9FABA|nr:hypothetical protein [Stylosanthes scabra]